ncbi:MAG: PilZ domain-containing protein [Gammaproteobacteria bacterium]|nr:PilZ domain-containing protein [Gammaproteobacteria bacterium]
MERGEENRRSFRVEEYIYLAYDLLSDEEFAEGLERRKLRLGASDGVRSVLIDIDARFSEKIFLLKNEASLVAECLTLLNDKIDIAISQVPNLKNSQTALANRAPQVCELSAEGMAFGTNEDLRPGTHVSLRFLIASENRYVESFATVIRQSEPPGNDTHHFPYGVAVEFVGMSSAQKEIIIQHLFSKESETLRMRRLELEASG